MTNKPITVWNRILIWLGSSARPALVLGSVLVLGVVGTNSYAEDDPFEDLMCRVQLLEEENRELRIIRRN